MVNSACIDGLICWAVGVHSTSSMSHTRMSTTAWLMQSQRSAHKTLGRCHSSTCYPPTSLVWAATTRRGGPVSGQGVFKHRLVPWQATTTVATCSSSLMSCAQISFVSIIIRRLGDWVSARASRLMSGHRTHGRTSCGTSALRAQLRRMPLFRCGCISTSFPVCVCLSATSLGFCVLDNSVRQLNRVQTHARADGGNHTTMPGEGHEDPTEAQVRWQVFTAIAYGARGLFCACCT